MAGKMELIRSRIGRLFGRPRAARLDLDQIRAMARAIATTRAGEIDCERCFEEMDRFAERRLAGGDRDRMMALVRDHLARCQDCREEFEALLAAMQAAGQAVA
jgi:hypothetical protein